MWPRKPLGLCSSLCKMFLAREAHKIANDPTFNAELEMLPSGQKFRLPKCKYHSFKNSLSSSSVWFVNNNMLQLLKHTYMYIFYIYRIFLCYYCFCVLYVFLVYISCVSVTEWSSTRCPWAISLLKDNKVNFTFTKHFVQVIWALGETKEAEYFFSLCFYLMVPSNVTIWGCS